METSLVGEGEQLPRSNNQEVTNRMARALEMFRSLVDNPLLVDMATLLFLNQKDVFAEKILTSDIAAQGPFADYAGPPRDYNSGVIYFIQRFKDCLFGDDFNDSYLHVTCASDTNIAEFILDCMRSFIMTDNLRRSGFLGNPPNTVELKIKNQYHSMLRLRENKLDWSESRETIPDALLRQGVRLEDWCNTWDAVCNQFLLNLHEANRLCACCCSFRRCCTFLVIPSMIVQVLLESEDLWRDLAKELYDKHYRSKHVKVRVCFQTIECRILCQKVDFSVPCGLAFTCKSGGTRKAGD